ISCTLEHAEVYYECIEPFKSLMCLWVRSKSIAAIWLEKVVTPLIDPAIKGFVAASAILKPERLKVDKHAYAKNILIASIRATGVKDSSKRYNRLSGRSANGLTNKPPSNTAFGTLSAADAVSDGDKSEQKQTKPGTKRKAWKKSTAGNQQKVKPDKFKAEEIKIPRKK
nr:hypothetical protein [Tanacetum cinerariifolium]